MLKKEEEHMKANRCRALFSLSFLLVWVLLTGFSVPVEAASNYPDRAISIVVPYPAGGLTDIAARALADAMEKHLKQPVVVVNKTGGRATIGGYSVVTEKPDGYTLGYFPIATCLPEVFTYFFDAPYSSADLRPIASSAVGALSFTVRADSPFQSFKDVVEYAKQNPGLKIASPGKQTLPYMVSQNVAKKEGVKFTDVPFSGDATTTPALLGGHVPVAAIDYSAVKSLVDAKKLRVLATCTKKRLDFAPDIPTMEELGYKLAYYSMLGLFGQKTLPEDVVKKIDETVAKVFKEQEFLDKMRNACIQAQYEGSVSYPKILAGFKESMTAFFKEEGLVK
jgi:tripartite-type tricarboxylate transporter receptor subunit TctC